MRLSFPLPLCGKNGKKISENTLEYYQKSEVVFKCIFVIRNDLNRIKVTGGLSKIFAQLHGTTKLWKNGQKIGLNILEYYQTSEVVFICIFVTKNDLSMIKITGGLLKMFAQLSGTTKFWKKCFKISSKIQHCFKCIFVIRNDLNMIKIYGGLSKMIAQLSGTTKFQQKVHQIQFLSRTSTITNQTLTADTVFSPLI